MVRVTVVLALVALAACATRSAFAKETPLELRLMPGDCAAFPVQIPAGKQTFQLTGTQLRASSVRVGCLQDAAGECAVEADDSDAACDAATQTGAPAATEGQLEVAETTTGYVYVRNDQNAAALIDMLVVVQPDLRLREQDAAGSYRRALLARAKAADASIAATAAQPLARAAHRKLLGTASSSTPSSNSSGPDKVTWKNWIDYYSNKVSPKARKWIKVAIIVAIVLIAISLLSCLICILKCICWPCCCAARGFK